MKKILMFIMFGIISFLGIKSVDAEVNLSNFYNSYPTYTTYSNYSSNISTLVDYWENNYSSDYPYYVIYGSNNIIYLTYLTTNTLYYYTNGGFLYPNNGFPSNISYNITNNSYNYNYSSSTIKSFIYSSNSDLLFADEDNCSANISTNCADTLSIPTYSNIDYNVSYLQINIKNGETIPTYVSLVSGDYKPNIPVSYVEIDLNKYAYVILSLKDYTVRDTFTSTMYVKGQLCPTTVYNYGMEEKKDYVSGYQTQPCSYYYNNTVPYTSYLKSEDIKNHAVYYLTAYDKSKPNLVSVDTSVYDITYITSENKNEPYVSISGKKYPVLSYDSLTDSSTLTEQNGISDEWTCAKYDTDCLENSSGMNISDLFNKPLEFLKGLWSSLTSIFEIITEFISLLPPTMQSFLYLSFMVAIVLGLLKLIL